MKNKYLLDTNVLINMGRGLFGIREKIISAGPRNCLVSAVSIAELKTGCHISGNAFEKANLDFCINNFRIVPVSGEILDRFAKMKAVQIGIGKKVPDFDLLIAATSVVHGLTVVSGDKKHFPLIQDILLVDWQDLTLP